MSPTSPSPRPSRPFGPVVRIGTVLVGYIALAVGLTWPLAPRLGELVPGAARSDLWNSLWSLWFVADALERGTVPWETVLLDHPGGGILLVADPLGAVLGLPLVAGLGLETAYGLLVIARIAAAGLVAHAATVWWRQQASAPGDVTPWWHPGPALAGVGVAAAPMLLAGVHNGTSESVSWAPMVLATWAALAAVMRPGWRTAVACGGALLLATLANPYSAVISYVLAGGLAIAPPRRTLLERARPILLGLAVSVPVAVLQHLGATHARNLVGIKNARELALVRRSTGAADPWTFLLGGDFRSPDFAEISRYGEAFIHTSYVGHVLVLVALVAVLRRRVRPWLMVGGGALAALALGPVWVQAGSAVIFADDRVLPLPYLLVERLPGFSSLSLVWRLAGGLVVAAALTAGASLARSWGPRWSSVPGWGLVGAVLVETLWLSPMHQGVALTDARVPPVVRALRDAPPGAVVNFPVAGGRAYLHEQTAHGHALAATLNFPNNTTGQRFWRKVLAELERVAGDRSPEEALEGDRARASFARGVAKTARALQVRYLVVHADPHARPDMHDGAARAIQRAFPPWAPADGVGPMAPAAAAGPHARSVTVHALY